MARGAKRGRSADIASQAAAVPASWLRATFPPSLCVGGGFVGAGVRVVGALGSAVDLRSQCGYPQCYHCSVLRVVRAH